MQKPQKPQKSKSPATTTKKTTSKKTAIKKSAIKKTPPPPANVSTSHLVISILGHHQKDQLICLLSSTIAASHCNIVEFRSSTLGEYLSAYLLLSGKWNQIAKAEALFAKLGQQEKLDIHVHPTTFSSPVDNKAVPYTIYVVGLDDAKKMHDIIEFFAIQKMVIIEVTQHTYHAKYTGSRMMSLTMQVSIPTNIYIADLRDRFMVFSDELNVDAIMEPGK